jgi:uncharacterized protein DUF2877
MVAATVATPVLERFRTGEADGLVRGATQRAAYLDFDGFVVALTAPGVPLMPNGVAVARSAVHDGPVRAAAGRIDLAGEAVTWDPSDPPAWEPALRRPSRSDAAALRERGAAILAALGVDERSSSAAGTGSLMDGDRGRDGLDRLRRALRNRDPRSAALAADHLTGLGGGLTPEGDDVLSATAAVVATTGEALGFRDPERGRWLAALVPADAPARTTALSATLLALAVDGRIVEPVHRLLDVSNRDGAWREGLATLAATGASTGRAYAVAVGTTLGLLSAGD